MLRGIRAGTQERTAYRTRQTQAADISDDFGQQKSSEYPNGFSGDKRQGRQPSFLVVENPVLA
jgi:hypothetical protein